MQIACEVPEVSSAGRRLRCRYLVRFYRGFLVQLPDEVPEGL